MIYSIFPELDASIYEYFPNRNTGIDQILELTKYTSHSAGWDGDIFTSNYNSRILMKFNLNEISSSISSGDISGNCQFFLNLNSIDATDLPISCSIYVYPVSGTWQNGNGNFNDIPEITEGVSWKYKTSYSLGDNWTTSSYAANTTGSWISTPGGANWYTNIYASQSLFYEVPDLRVDVTDIVKAWLSGSIVNNGFIIKRNDYDEATQEILGSIKFYGKDTHTIFMPKLEVAWNDVTSSGTLTQTTDENYVVYIKNLQDSYYESDRQRIRVACRPMFPQLTYATSSAYLPVYILPTSSYYEVRDAYTNHVMIPYDTTYTKLSSDSSGNYFNIRMNSLFPDRIYKLVIKTVETGMTRYHDNGFTFKIHK